MRASTTVLVLQRAAVAVGLAGVTAAVMVPLLSHCRCRGPQSQSLSNVKQLTLGILQYAQDYDGRLPGWVRNPDGRFAHNTWDEQITDQAKSEEVYRMPQDGPGIRSYADPMHQRVLSYGMNALLLAGDARPFDGHADLRRPPERPLALADIPRPAETILLAEVATRQALPPPYGEKPDPAPFTGVSNAGYSREWRNAHDGWIDISPRDWVENTPAPGCYRPSRWNAQSGVAREPYKVNGGSYGFLDGHVKVLRPPQTVSDGTVAPDRYWSPDNTHNLWNPRVWTANHPPSG